jgi:hypothetical protein
MTNKTKKTKKMLYDIELRKLQESCNVVKDKIEAYKMLVYTSGDVNKAKQFIEQKRKYEESIGYNEQNAYQTLMTEEMNFVYCEKIDGRYGVIWDITNIDRDSLKANSNKYLSCFMLLCDLCAIHVDEINNGIYWYINNCNEETSTKNTVAVIPILGIIREFQGNKVQKIYFNGLDHEGYLSKAAWKILVPFVPKRIRNAVFKVKFEDKDRCIRRQVPIEYGGDLILTRPFDFRDWLRRRYRLRNEIL